MRLSNDALSAYVHKFDKLAHADKVDALLTLIDYVRGEGAAYGIAATLRDPHGAP